MMVVGPLGAHPHLLQVLFLVLQGDMPSSSPVYTSGGASLDADGPSMWQVVPGYNVTGSRDEPDLTWT